MRENLCCLVRSGSATSQRCSFCKNWFCADHLTWAKNCVRCYRGVHHEPHYLVKTSHWTCWNEKCQTKLTCARFECQHPKCADKKLNRVRRRSTYGDFRKMYEAYKTGPKAVLTLLFDVIDGRHGYNSGKNANYAEESLKQFIEDNKL